MINLNDFIEAGTLEVMVGERANFVIVKRDLGDFIIINTSDATYMELPTIIDHSIFGDCDIFPRKGAVVYSWSDYANLIKAERDEEIERLF